MKGKISEKQSGFMSGRSCVDNLFILQQLAEKRISIGEELHMAFIDLEKAYDTIPRQKLWEALYQLNINPQMLAIIQEIYKENLTYIKVGKCLSSPINSFKGLKQECCLSPLLFNLYVEVVLRNWKKSCGGMGVPVGDHNLFTFSFADDQVVIAQNSYDLEFMIRRLYTEYEKWGLHVNLKKTEFLVVNSEERNFEILINDGSTIVQVEEFKYLGAVVDKNGIDEREIKHRLQEAKKIIDCLNSLWWDRNIFKKTYGTGYGRVHPLLRN
jgi:Reverse transcriptase (RNA-dependent DNA polymerase)